MGPRARGFAASTKRCFPSWSSVRVSAAACRAAGPPRRREHPTLVTTVRGAAPIRRASRRQEIRRTAAPGRGRARHRVCGPREKRLAPRRRNTAPVGTAVLTAACFPAGRSGGESDWPVFAQKKYLCKNYARKKTRSKVGDSASPAGPDKIVLNRGKTAVPARAGCPLVRISAEITTRVRSLGTLARCRQCSRIK